MKKLNHSLINLCGEKTGGKILYIFILLSPGKKVYLHRLIFGLFGGFVLDHRNRNTTDNRLENLRACDHNQNSINSIRSRKKYKYRGIYQQKKKWAVNISVNGIMIRRYGFKTDTEAAMVYDALAKEYHGEFAVLNFPDANNKIAKQALEEK